MFARILILVVLAVVGHSVHGQNMAECGSLTNAYGPFDYTNPVHKRDLLPRVEEHHFDAGVEQLRGMLHMEEFAGKQATGAALDYTLRAFPNHHRALYAMSKYDLIAVKEKRPPMRYSADCYFERAMRFKPDDGTVRLIYGIYLFKRGDNDAAVTRFKEALDLNPESAEVHYNIGLIYADMGNYDDATHHADRAYALGYPMPGLRNKLIRAGVWDRR